MVQIPDALVQWRVVYVALLAAFLGLGLAPAVLDRTGWVRRLDASERRRLAAGGVDPTGVRVLDAASRSGSRSDRGPEPEPDPRPDPRPEPGSRPRGSRSATGAPAGGASVAFAAGLVPGAGRVVVSRALLGSLSDEELAAVVTHERGHLRRGHVLLRLGVPTAFVVAWTTAAAAGVPGGFAAGLALVGPVALASFALSRWTEVDADRFAARRGLGPALARTLERLHGAPAGAAGSPSSSPSSSASASSASASPRTTADATCDRRGPTVRLRLRPLLVAGATLLARHPPVEARVARLRTGGERRGEAADDPDRSGDREVDA